MTTGPRHSIPVIGLVGPIGSGKSAAARALAELGCVVSDSDAAAREAMHRPEVADELVRWWGDAITNPDGTINRKAVADIVFADPEQRERLESLIHPLVHDARRELFAAAEARGAVALVIDAPLLLEAGLDAECDVVIFVDTPRQICLDRVQKTRGWDESELIRREKAQLPLEDKQSRSDYVIVNGGSVEQLGRKIGTVLDEIRRDFPSSND